MAKKPKKQKPNNQLHKVYTVSGDKLELKNKKCPKCNVFMADHKDRISCGKCGYMEKK